MATFVRCLSDQGQTQEFPFAVGKALLVMMQDTSTENPCPRNLYVPFEPDSRRGSSAFSSAAPRLATHLTVPPRRRRSVSAARFRLPLGAALIGGSGRGGDFCRHAIGGELGVMRLPLEGRA